MLSRYMFTCLNRISYYIIVNAVTVTCHKVKILSLYKYQTPFLHGQIDI